MLISLIHTYIRYLLAAPSASDFAKPDAYALLHNDLCLPAVIVCPINVRPKFQTLLPMAIRHALIVTGNADPVLLKAGPLFAP